MLKGVGTQSTPIGENPVLSARLLCNPKITSNQNLKKKKRKTASAGPYFVVHARRKALAKAGLQEPHFPAVLAAARRGWCSGRWRPLVEPPEHCTVPPG